MSVDHCSSWTLVLSASICAAVFCLAIQGGLPGQIEIDRVGVYKFKNFTIKRGENEFPAEGPVVEFKIDPQLLIDADEGGRPAVAVFFNAKVNDNYYPFFRLLDEDGNKTDAYVSTPDYASIEYEPHDLPAPRTIAVEFKNWDPTKIYTLSVRLLPRNEDSKVDLEQEARRLEKEKAVSLFY